MSGKITEMRGAGAQSERVVVFVDGAPAFTVSAEVAERLELAVGRELAPRENDELEASDERERARESALRLLTVRARSEGELRDRLREKGFADAVAAETIAALAEVGLVDDAAFARAWADERVRLRPVGPRRLSQELAQKRVPRGIADGVVEETFREHDEFELARRAVRGKLRAPGTTDARKRRARLYSFLVRRGFSYEVVSAVLKETEGDPDA